MPSFDLEFAKQRMLRKHLRGRGIHDQRVLEAMARVPRERFIGPLLHDQAYADRALTIDCSQTISQPYIVALMSEALELTGREKVLEVGTGSGYQTAVLAELSRQVISIERHRQLSAAAGALLAELGYTNIRQVVGDGTQGWADEAPYNRIIVTAAAAMRPTPLEEQLEDGGVLVIPVGGSECQILQAIRKQGNRLDVTNLSPCRFVPLIGAEP